MSEYEKIKAPYTCSASEGQCLLIVVVVLLLVAAVIEVTKFKNYDFMPLEVVNN